MMHYKEKKVMTLENTRSWVFSRMLAQYLLMTLICTTNMCLEKQCLKEVSQKERNSEKKGSIKLIENNRT